MSQPHRTHARGRAAENNPANRFDRLATFGIDDGWGRDDDLPVLRTEVTVEPARKIITRNTSPDVPFDRSINPYRGCEHGCIYCFARPTHAYLGLSPGLDFETRLVAKQGAADMLARELSNPRYQARPIAIGTNTDAYQPIERARRIMHDILTVLRDFNHPVTITTKGSLIERDIDLIADMARDDLVHVSMSVTTLDAAVSRKMEPRVPSPARRLKTIEKLAGQGVRVGISASPIIPGLTDHELEAILKAGADAGAQTASCIPLRLPREVSGLFQDWLAAHFPDRATRVMARVRETHGGQDYDPEWGKRMRGTGIYAKLIYDRFKAGCKRYGLNHRGLGPADNYKGLRCDLFAKPPQRGDQLDLF